ncbi:MAG: hypothetical protein KatS3mg038_2845 [Candidatus Kapaibacterium sp.]|nr:MAG: hypothetical protein KatS3mg038_2845 [Candidatus Kapabacteria bacterium]
MSTQKYGMVHPAIPPSFAAMLVLSAGGWVGALLMPMPPAVVFPLAVGVFLLCASGLWIEEIRRWCFLLGSLMVGVCLGVRMNLHLPIASHQPSDMPAWLDGTISQVLSSSGSRMSCIIEGTLDPKLLPPRQNVRILVYAEPPPISPSELPGRRAVATVDVRIPRRRELPYGISEWQAVAPYSAELIAYAKRGTFAILEAEPAAQNWIARLRRMLLRTTDSIFADAQSRTLARALILGDRSLLDRQTRQLFSRTGTAHILSVSGFHVGVVAALLALISTIVRDRRVRFALFVAGVWLYVLLTGAHPPAVRAGAAVTLGAALLLSQRWIPPLHAVALVLWVMIAIEPNLLVSVSFQLSAAAVLGIVTIGSPLSQRWKALLHSKLLQWIAASIAITIGATLATAPLVAYYFGVVPVISLVANIAVVPLASAFIIAGIVSIGAGMISFGIGRFYASVAELLAQWMLWVIEQVAQLDWSLAGPLLVPLSSGALLAAWYIFRSTSWRHMIFRFGVATIAFALLWAVLECILQLPSQRELTNGAIAVEFRGKEAALITLKRRLSVTSPLAKEIADYCILQCRSRVYIRAATPEALPLAHSIARRLEQSATTGIIIR